jgi:hypothetical protein
MKAPLIPEQKQQHEDLLREFVDTKHEHSLGDYA